MEQETKVRWSVVKIVLVILSSVHVPQVPTPNPCALVGVKAWEGLFTQIFDFS